MDPTSANFTLSREVLLQNLVASRLLSQDEMDRIAAGPHPGAVGLAHALVESGLVTPYQLDLISQGRQDELRFGNYDVIGRLGAGGMGTVFKARHRRMKRVVALKVLSSELCKDVAFVQRFQREVETIAKLSHPNVVMAYDADECEAGHFLVMEFVNGRDLASLVDGEGPLSVYRAIDCVLQAAMGLAYAHEQGIIHRDIKPHNLLLDQSGTLKVTDLGLARAIAGSQGGGSNLTQAGGLLGTSNYMPPEQATDPTQIDHRADIYALGCTLHFLLTGSPPFTGPSVMSVLIKHREAPPPSLAAARPDVPAQLDLLFQRMLAKAPEQRPKTMADVVAALTPLRESAPTAPGPAPAGQPPVFIGSSTATNRAASNTSPGTQQDAASLTVLVVEPSRVQGGIIRKYLEAQGVTVLAVAHNGQEALKAAGAAAPGCVVSALHLSDMTGLELAQKVRQQAQGAAPGFVLVSSENDSGSALTQFSKALMLHKPFTPEQLVEAVNIVTGRSIKVRDGSLSVSMVNAPRPSGLSSPGIPRKVDRSTLPVLIVDDSAAARANERSTLTKLGFSQFTEAADGAQAVAAISTALVPFALIVTDYNMPLMDGKALLGYLKQNPVTSGVPVFMVTTEANAQALAAVRALGVAGLFPKAFPAAEVKAAVDKLF